MSLPEHAPVTRVAFAGVDWAKDNHAVCVIDPDGQPLAEVVFAHSRATLDRMITLLRGHEVSAVGIERGDGPVVAALLAAGLTVFVIAPSQVKALRRRYCAAGHKSDRFDAFVLADTVRTDTRRLTPLRPDTPDTLSLRALVRARKDLVGHRVAIANQLRAHLDTALPAVVGLFHSIDAPISRAFIAAFSTQPAIDALTVEDLTAWLRAHRYTRNPATALLHQLHAAPTGITGPAAATLATITHAYLHTLDTITNQINTLDQQITTALSTHPDHHIFTSLPRTGTIRAARLLAEIGDARGRFPTPAALAGLAGVTPSTRRSGQTTIVAYRWAVDKQLRDAICDFAADSRHANPWAANLYTKARNRGHRHPHAVRILARAWLTIIWKCWTTHTPYQPHHHRTLQTLLNQDQTPAG
jgi:transposase